jgi:serine/threonine protein kinase
MGSIDPRLLFSRPIWLSSAPTHQVIRFTARFPRSAKKQAETVDCVLKLFTSAARTSYDKEVAVYARLNEIDSKIPRPKLLGCAEWSREKYAKTVGKGIPLLPAGTKFDSLVFVLMLEFLERSQPISTIATIPLDLAKSALSHLDQLHSLAIVHGDISLSNILIISSDQADEPFNTAWVDFSSSWTDASSKQILWEHERAIEYFSQWVSPLTD